MPYVNEARLQEAWVKYNLVRRRLPWQLQKLTFNDFFKTVPIIHAYPIIAVEHNIASDDAKRLDKFLGPHGSTLFLVWAHNQCRK